MAKYIDLRCDFGFKYCMQDEIVMKSFLNAILEGETDRITSVKFENVEVPRENRRERGVTFDLLCTTEKEEKILIEMQNASQTYFKTRATFYVYQLMKSLIPKGFRWEKMEYDIPRIFGIFIMGKNDAYLTKAVTRTSVYDRDELTEFWDRNHNFYISLPKFKLDKKNATTKDIWFHMFKDLGKMEKIDDSVYDRADEGLLRLIEKAKISALSEEEQKLYDASMKALEDEIDMEEHGYKRGKAEGLTEGIAKGIAQGKAEGRTEGKTEERQMIISNLRLSGFSDESIAEMTKIPIEEIREV